tara:strand:- start:2853 stop:2987 length:135 start_codon:yes stop_codon:yes gene_type:complete
MRIWQLVNIVKTLITLRVVKKRSNYGIYETKKESGEKEKEKEKV